MKRNHKFTLIELLVVVAVIGVIISLLQPALAKTIEIAERTSCQSNLKQIGVAYQMYPEDNDGWLVLGGNMVWEYELRDYLGLKFPEAKRDYRYFDAKNTVVECLTYDYAEERAAPLYGGYAFNTIFLGNTREDQRKHTSQIEEPSETLVVGDGMNYIENNVRYHILYRPTYIPWHAANGYGEFTYMRHSEGTNLVWMDGHVSFEDWYLLKNGKNGDIDYFYKLKK